MSGNVKGDAAERKAQPLFTGVLKYFPQALAEVAKVSKAGNDQHNPGQPLHWAKEKSRDELDALARHLVDCGTRDTDGIRHSAKVAWRALANLEREIEREQGYDYDAETDAWSRRPRPLVADPTSMPIPTGDENYKKLPQGSHISTFWPPLARRK